MWCTCGTYPPKPRTSISTTPSLFSCISIHSILAAAAKNEPPSSCSANVPICPGEHPAGNAAAQPDETNDAFVELAAARVCSNPAEQPPPPTSLSTSTFSPTDVRVVGVFPSEPEALLVSGLLPYRAGLEAGGAGGVTGGIGDPTDLASGNAFAGGS